MSRIRKLGLPFLAVLGLWLGRDWLRLGWQAWDYPSAAEHARGQLVIQGGNGYLAASADGIEVLDILGKRHATLLAVPKPADRSDDLAITDNLLFALDATPPGHLFVYSLADPLRPALVRAPVPVEVGPFSGVSAAAGIVAVSGGTSRLSLRSYDAHGQLGSQVAFADFGRGQPDVTPRLSPGPTPLPANWSAMVNRAETPAELAALQRPAHRGTPYGSERWQQQTAFRLGLASTLCPRGRSRKRVKEKR